MTSGSSSIDYEALQTDAMRAVVRAVLQRTAKSGLPGDHHFYISFDTTVPGVGLSKRLKEKYPAEMTIVLQHRFWDLLVSEDRFEVKLTFDGIPERLVVPFAALKVFFDPSVRFGLQFEDALTASLSKSSSAIGAEEDAGQATGRTPPKKRAQRKTKPERDSAANGSREPASDVARIAPNTVSKPGKPAAVGPMAAQPTAASEASDAKAGDGPAGAQIVSLDQFRKK